MYIPVTSDCRVSEAAFTRDVPDIRFRFRMAGYPAVFYYPVPAQLFPETRYLNWIICGP